MTRRVIPILPLHIAEHAAEPPRLSGPAARVERIHAALQAAVTQALGLAPPGWLRELRLGADEVFVAVAPDLGRDGMKTAQIAFETLRRLLPDTDIYVGAEAS